jgi:2-polyprenyl-3-methyl-5-hydroxy-6-metoxy-1,4-benzoquinol methylase
LFRSCRSGSYWKVASRGAYFVRGLIRRIFALGSRKARAKLEQDFLQDLLDDLMSNPATGERVDYILGFGSDDVRFKGELTSEERALPGDEEFQRSGWSKVMFTRYTLGMHYSKGKCVLDSCCGLGWGSYLVDAVAESVIALDNAGPVVKLARSLWPTQRTTYIQGSVLSLSLLSNSVDTVLAMESIEHFELANIHRYLDELYRVLKPGGMLIGSSAFPETEEQAKTLCARNPYHLHICTRAELDKMLAQRFRNHYIYQNALFFWAEK